MGVGELYNQFEFIRARVRKPVSEFGKKNFFSLNGGRVKGALISAVYAHFTKV